MEYLVLKCDIYRFISHILFWCYRTFYMSLNFSCYWSWKRIQHDWYFQVTFSKWTYFLEMYILYNWRKCPSEDTPQNFLSFYLFYLMTTFKHILLNKISMSWFFFQIPEQSYAILCLCSVMYAWHFGKLQCSCWTWKF